MHQIPKSVCYTVLCTCNSMNAAVKNNFAGADTLISLVSHDTAWAVMKQTSKWFSPIMYLSIKLLTAPMLERENVPPVISLGESWFLSPSLWMRFSSTAISNTVFNCKEKKHFVCGRKLVLTLILYLTLLDIWYHQPLWHVHGYTDVVVSFVSDCGTFRVCVAVKNRKVL